MPRRRLTKRSKLNDAVDSSASPVAAIVSSSEESEDSDPALSPVLAEAAPVVVDLIDALQSLGTSTNEAEASQAMKSLTVAISTHSNAETFMDAQGLSVIVCSLLRYKGSAMVVGNGFKFLCHLTCILETDQIGETLEVLNVIDKISIFATSATNVDTSWNAAILLGNLSWNARNLETKVKLASSANVKFMMNRMTSDPDDFCGILCPCIYFDNLINVSEAKDQMLEHGVILPLAVVYHRFRTWNGGTEEENSDAARILKICKALLPQLVV